jgi:hypothetical protein
MNTVSVLIPSRPPTIAQPLPASEYRANAANPVADDAEAVSKMLASLIHDESVLYAISMRSRASGVTTPPAESLCSCIASSTSSFPKSAFA